MGGIGIAFLLMGYTLIYAGFKNVSPIQELAYGLGLDTDPFLDKRGALMAQAAAENKRDTGSGSPFATERQGGAFSDKPGIKPYKPFLIELKDNLLGN